PNYPLEGAARSVTAAEDQQRAKTRLRPARICANVLAGRSAAEIPQAAAAVRTRLHGSGASLGSEPIQLVCFLAGGYRARAPRLFCEAEYTGYEAPGGHCAARGIGQAQPAIPSNVPYHLGSCRPKHELAGRLPRRSASRQPPNPLELVRTVSQAGLCRSGRPSSFG